MLGKDGNRHNEVCTTVEEIVPGPPTAQPAWFPAAFDLGLDDLANYAMLGEVLGQHTGNKRTQTVNIKLIPEVVDLIDLLINKHREFKHVSNFVQYCTYIVLLTLAKHGIPDLHPIPTVLAWLEQESVDRRQEEQLLEIDARLSSAQVLVADAQRAGEWRYVADLLVSLDRHRDSAPYDFLKRTVIAAVARHPTLVDAIIWLATQAPTAVPEEAVERAKSWMYRLKQWQS